MHLTKAVEAVSIAKDSLANVEVELTTVVKVLSDDDYMQEEIFFKRWKNK